MKRSFQMEQALEGRPLDSSLNGVAAVAAVDVVAVDDENGG